MRCEKCGNYSSRSDSYCRRCGAEMRNTRLPVKRPLASPTVWSQAAPVLARGAALVALGVAAEIASRGNFSTDTELKSQAGLCLFGGLFHLFNHAAFKSLLFLSSGSIEQQAGTRLLKEMGGLARRMPVTSFCCRIGALSISGVPPFNGFFSKLIIIIALAWAGHPVLAGLAVLVALETLLSFIKVQRYALEGEVAGKSAAAHEAPASMCVAMLVLAAVCVASGLAIIWLREYLFTPASEALLKTASAAVGGAAP
ncbi:hypothetical protein LCGC14_2244240 [marine sediment metagenome]|uniref:NADH:quinone oxidoreductase/Mrp antiporter transmembrane domain-containing protein n=1 Tax=marine sediment metagenome TaxID=412755 RepID=A0A0F9D4Q3_9ZZZZ